MGKAVSVDVINTLNSNGANIEKSKAFSSITFLDS